MNTVFSPADGNWQLPEGVHEYLPAQAARNERLRREVLDRMQVWGYRLVEPPLVEFTESLLTGSGRDLDLQTARVTDQLSGRMLGVRADMTPQVARIDAHRLRESGPTRLCYAAPVLRARPQTTPRPRLQLQMGAELYGAADIEADIEVASLMLETVAGCGIDNLHLDLGHVGVFTALARRADLPADAEQALFDALQRKAVGDIEQQLSSLDVDDRLATALSSLVRLNGNAGDVLEQARELLAAGGDDLEQALAELQRIAERLAAAHPDVTLHLDLAELRGFRFHTGPVFAVFAPGFGMELARGGRYDDIGRAFGRARPATGFSADLYLLAQQGHRDAEVGNCILAPGSPGQDAALDQEVQRLRASGQSVQYALGGEPPAHDQQLLADGNTWRVVTPSD